MEGHELFEVDGQRDARARAAAWRDGVPPLFGALRVQTPPSGLARGRIEAWQLGRGRLVSIRSAPQRVVRVPGRAGLDSIGRSFHVLAQLEASSHVEHAGRARRLQAGELLLVDGALPFTLAFERPFAQLLLALPRELVLRRHEALALAAGTSGDPRAARMVFDVLRAIAGSAHGLDAVQRACALESCVGALGALQVRPRSLALDRVERAMAEIEAELPSLALDACTIAARQGISRRRLDALFALRGYSVSGWIWERRLARAAADLREPALAQRRVVEIAFAYGFSDASHFARAFRARFGMTPTAWRRS